MAEKYLTSNNLRLCYEEFGAPNNPALVLIVGLGTQMIAWPDRFCNLLANSGLRVIRFDNRDIGLSQKIETSTEVNLFSLMLRQKLRLSIDAPYSLHDMAHDTVGILDFLEIDKAHWVGASMGGMIAQVLAAEFPHRTQSLTSIMSTSGRRGLPKASTKVLRQMMTRPCITQENAYLKHALETWRLIGSPQYPPEREALVERIMRSAKRSSYPKGYRNQVAAIMQSGDRRGLLRKIDCPTLLIHGTEDVLVPAQGSVDLAENIRGSRLELIEGMGHDLPEQLLGHFTHLINNLIEDPAMA